MEETDLKILKGKELSSEDLSIINKARKEEFYSKSQIQPSPENEEWNKLYFLLNRSDQLVAFGRLHEVDVELEGCNYHIFGIATIVSLEKGKGYGRIIMQGIKKYILSTQKTGLGFCNSNVTEFYRKCGYDILKDGQDRFKYITPAKYNGGDVIYIKGRDNLVEKMIANKKIIANISRAHW